MQFKRVSVLLTLALIFCLASCAKSPPDDGRLRVAVTTDALYEMASYLGGERVNVIKLIPDGAELHDFEPSAKDIVLLADADILIINGLGLEPWIADAVNASGSDTLVTIDASTGITPIPAADHGDEFDPHIWLSPVCARKMAENIRDALISIDSQGKNYYTENCHDFTSKTYDLQKEYQGLSLTDGHRTLVTAHAIFAYLCRDFELTQESVEGVFAEGEPSPQRLAELVDFCRENGITTVFAEKGSSMRIVETLAREAGAEVVTIYTLESAEDGLSYLERMEYNLAAIEASVQR